MPENKSDDDNNVTLEIHCHCKLASYTLSIQSHFLPLGSAICHCSSCRHVTGQLAGSFVALPPQVDLDVSQLTRYASSDWYTRYFCPRCGADVANYAGDKWRVCTGLLNRIDGLLERKQIFVDGTRDGGMSRWLEFEKKVGGGEGQPETGTYFGSQKKDGTAEVGEESIFATCHCGGVQFMLTRPDGDEDALGTDVEGDGGKRDSGRRYDAVLCACDSCRFTTGFELVAWAFVPRANIRMVNGSPFELESDTLTHYESSSGITRDFCSTCGATAFYRKDSRKPEMWDVAVGLLQAESGVRAEDWLSWKDKVDFGEEAVDQGLVRLLEEGLKSWKEGRSDGSDAT